MMMVHRRLRSLENPSLLATVQSFLTPAELSILTQCSLPRSSSSRRIVVGMSGGVDSSVSALLLRAFGYDVRGIWMSNWNAEGHECEREFADAQHVADYIGIDCHRLDLSKEYWLRVWAPCLDSFAQGQTPNPDIWCNREIKFGAFRQLAQSQFNADVVATGHYARLVNGRLHRALDPTKDQSYFLSMVSRLDRACFPVGGLTKARVRQLAHATGLGERIASKPDSVGVCFIGKRPGSFGAFLQDFLPNPAAPGEFFDVDSGHYLGPTGVSLLGLTCGQRAKIPGRAEPYYIVAKDLASGRVTVAQGPKHPALFTRTLALERVSATERVVHARAQVGSREPEVACRVEWGPGSDAQVRLDAPVRRPAVGQVVALYLESGECVGAGVVRRSDLACEPPL